MNAEQTLPSAGLDATEASVFLRALWGQKAEEGHILIWQLDGKRSRWFKNADEASAFVDAEQRTDIYVGVGLSPEDRGPKQRCAAADVVGVAGLWADIDLLGPAHKKQNLPPDEAAARKLLARLGLKPTLLIHSGHGFQPWWLFEEPIAFEVAEERERFAAVARGWHRYIQSHARAMGYDVDPVADLARVLRVPGTMNTKDPDAPVPVRILESDGPRYTDVNAFEALVPADLAPEHNEKPANDALIEAMRAAVSDGEILNRARRSANGGKFARLWAGDTSAHPSQSEADASLVEMLAFHCGAPDRERVDKLFRQSGLYREKWDERHSGDGRSYGDGTIDFVLSKMTTFYTGAPERPRYEGPHGLALELDGLAKRTAHKKSCRFRILVDGDLKGNLNASDCSSGLKVATRDLLELLPDSPPHAERDVRAFLRKAINESPTEPPPGEPVDAKLTMRAIVREAAREFFDLRFVTEKGAWSERLGRVVTRQDFTGWMSEALLDELRKAVDAPGDPKDQTLVGVIEKLLKVAWSSIARDLPDEEHADSLGPDSRAAAEWRRCLVRILTCTSTAVLVNTVLKDGTPGEKAPVRTSIIGRLQYTINHTELPGPDSEHQIRNDPRHGWVQLHLGMDVWWRLHGGRPWLAFRFTLCGQVDKAPSLPGVHDQESLTRLAKRYGVSSPEDNGPPSRLSERHRLVALDRVIMEDLMPSPESQEHGRAGSARSAQGRMAHRREPGEEPTPAREREPGDESGGTQP